MSKTRKIAECINVRINVGNYQHIELVKYSEETIEFDTDKERIEKENALRDDLVANLMRSMAEIPAKMGKGVAEAQAVEEAIKTKLPDWLANGPVPNIANTALKKEIQVSAEQKDKKDVATKIIEDALVAKPTETKATKATETKATPRPTEIVAEPKVEIEKIADANDLFENDEVMPSDKDLFDEDGEKPVVEKASAPEPVKEIVTPVVTEPKKEEKKVTEKPSEKPSEKPVEKAKVEKPVVKDEFNFDDDDFLK